MRPKLTLTLGIACGLLLLAGCGGDDGEKGGGEGVTKAEYIRQGDAICKRTNAKFEEISKEQGSLDTEADLREYADKVVPVARKQIADLAKLPKPAGDEQTLQATYDQAAQITDTLERDPSGMSGNREPYSEVSNQLQLYGFTDCAE